MIKKIFIKDYILIDEFMSPRRTTVAEVNNIPNEDEVVFCRKCGTKLLERSQFCRKCGTEIVEETGEVVENPTLLDE